MSTEENLSRKAKKAQRDAERKKAGKKRKREDVEESAEGQDELKNDFIPLAGGDESTIAKDTSTSSPKKRKTAGTSSVERHIGSEETAGAKAKRRRKSKSTAQSEGGGTGSDAKENAASEAKNENDNPAKPTKSRFILFIGNLPYSATDANITAHFKRIQPFALRHRVDPKTKKSKGFAFLEFENYDRMKTCLKLYHHSTFDPAQTASDNQNGENGSNDPKKTTDQGGKKGKKNQARRINVELTAGGGGKGDERKEKIKAKNAKLEEERKRRREAEEKAAARKEKKEKQGLRKTGTNTAPAGKMERTEKGEHNPDEEMEGVHPARLARMKA